MTTNLYNISPFGMPQRVKRVFVLYEKRCSASFVVSIASFELFLMEIITSSVILEYRSKSITFSDIYIYIYICP